MQPPGRLLPLQRQLRSRPPQLIFEFINFLFQPEEFIISPRELLTFQLQGLRELQHLRQTRSVLASEVLQLGEPRFTAFQQQRVGVEIGEEPFDLSGCRLYRIKRLLQDRKSTRLNS